MGVDLDVGVGVDEDVGMGVDVGLGLVEGVRFNGCVGEEAVMPVDVVGGWCRGRHRIRCLVWS